MGLRWGGAGRGCVERGFDDVQLWRASVGPRAVNGDSRGEGLCRDKQGVEQRLNASDEVSESGGGAVRPAKEFGLLHVVGECMGERCRAVVQR